MHRRAPIPTAALLSALVALPGCSDGAATGEGWAGSVTDSAGVPVVANPVRGTWGEGEAWTVREEISIGGLGEDPAYQFGQVAGVDVDGEGNLWVLDQQAREVRVFSPEGAWLRTVGSPGSGPGEIGMAAVGVFLVGDEVRVPDLQNQRVNRYALDGTPLGDLRLDLQQGVPMRWDGPLDGRLVAQVRVLDFTNATAATGGDMVVAYGPDGAVADTLLALPAGESLSFQGGMPRFRIFEPEPMWDLGEDGRLVSGRNHEFRLEVRDASGALARVVTLPRERPEVTERDKQVFLDVLRETMESQGSPPQAVEMMMQNVSFADRFPAFVTLLAGPGGTVWVQRLRTGDDIAGSEATSFDIQEMGSPDWDVFDEDGRYLGIVSFPDRVQPLGVDGERILTVARDELDVQRVAVFRLER